MTLLVMICALAGLSEGKAQSDGKLNLLKSTENIDDPAWLGFSRASTVTGGVEDPDGGKTAFHVDVKKGWIGQIVNEAKPDRLYVFSVWMRSAGDPSQQVVIAFENNDPARLGKFTPVQVSSEWKRYSVDATCPTQGNKNFRISIRGCDVIAWHPQMEDVTDKGTKEPSDYASSGGAPVLSVTLPPDVGAVEANAMSINISCWGDSLTQGAGGKPYPTVLQSACADRKVFNGGVGGEKSGQIKDRFMAGSDKWGDITVIWAGRNNYENPNAVISDIISMVEKLKTRRFVILGVLNGEREIKGGGGQLVITKINKDLAKLFPNNFIDIRSILVAAYDRNAEKDVADNQNDVPPASLRSDGLHLNTAGYQRVADEVLKFLKDKKWVTQ